MIVCIDGNNYLRLYSSQKKGITDSQKKSFVRQLCVYQAERSTTITEILVVFDAGTFGHATREVHSGIVVMHSGQKSSADEWICQFVARHKNKEILLVSNDRALVAAVCGLGAKAIACDIFYGLLRQALESAQGAALLDTSGDLIKYHHDDSSDEFGKSSNQLDALMEQASRRFTPKDELTEGKKENRASSAKKLSKLEKKTDKAIKKL